MDNLKAVAAGLLANRADPEKALRMAAYMKTDMPFFGVQKSGRTEVFRELKKQFPIDGQGAYRDAVETLWEQPHREEKYLAIGIAKGYKEYISIDNFGLYKRLIIEGAWWDFVDDIAVNCVGIAYLQQRKEAEPIIKHWIDDDCMWLRRTSLISPLKHKAATDYELLFDHCLRRAHEKEFFIRKAIGWTLREYAKTAPDRVRDFLLANKERWSGLTLREAGKHLDI